MPNMWHITLNWKPVYKVNLFLMENELKDKFPTYRGNMANMHLTLWFEGEFSQEILNLINTYWETEVPLAYNKQLIDGEFERCILE